MSTARPSAPRPLRPGSLRLLAAILLLPLLAAPARADQRHFAWTYEAQTLAAGEAEIESYTTLSSAELGEATGRTATNLQLELEVGMTDRFDFGLYQVFDQEPDQGLVYAGYKLRFRYRLGEPERRPFAAVAYLEYKGLPDYSRHAFEVKGIAARDFGSFRLALNPALEFEQEGSEWKMEPEYAAGAAWLSGDLLSLGLEVRGSEEAHYLGPVIGHGAGDLWVALGAAVRVSGDAATTAEVETRLLVGFEIR
ncbi:hypothetical protein FJ251_15125 [bacterium]|nr:hypothetical protein [bacterium]